MLKIPIVSLSGGQGKTTTALFLAKHLASMGFTVLTIDADPQANLSTYLEYDPEPGSNTLLEVLKGSDSLGRPIESTEGIYQIQDGVKLFLIPSNRSLIGAQEFLNTSGAGAFMLRQRLKPLENLFDVCIIDSPPSESQLVNTVIGAGDRVIIPFEVNLKGFGCLMATLATIRVLSRILESVNIDPVSPLGIMPFRDRWTGKNRTLIASAVLEEVGASTQIQADWLLPPFRESTKVVEAIANGTDLGSITGVKYALDEPIKVLGDKVAVILGKVELNHV